MNTIFIFIYRILDFPKLGSFLFKLQELFKVVSSESKHKKILIALKINITTLKLTSMLNLYIHKLNIGTPTIVIDHSLKCINNIITNFKFCKHKEIF